MAQFITTTIAGVAERFEVSLARELLAFGISQPRNIVSLRQLENFIDKNVVSSMALKNDPQIEIAVAYVNLYVHNDFDGVLDYLKQSNVASTSTLTPIMLDLWQEAQWRKSEKCKRGRQDVNTSGEGRCLKKVPATSKY